MKGLPALPALPAFSYTPSMPLRATPQTLIAFCLGGILLIVAVESLFPKTNVPFIVDKPPVEEECKGEAIKVSYPYEGGMLDPWECQVQCEDKKQRYIVYTNGKATPCEELPGCLDYGEDYGITCLPPGTLKSTTGSSVQK